MKPHPNTSNGITREAKVDGCRSLSKPNLCHHWRDYPMLLLRRSGW